MACKQEPQPSRHVFHCCAVETEQSCSQDATLGHVDPQACSLTSRGQLSRQNSASGCSSSSASARVPLSHQLRQGPACVFPPLPPGMVWGLPASGVPPTQPCLPNAAPPGACTGHPSRPAAQGQVGNTPSVDKAGASMESQGRGASLWQGRPNTHCQDYHPQLLPSPPQSVSSRHGSSSSSCSSSMWLAPGSLALPRPPLLQSLDPISAIPGRCPALCLSP